MYDVYFCDDEHPTYKGVSWEEAVKFTTGLPQGTDFDIVESGRQRYEDDPPCLPRT